MHMNLKHLQIFLIFIILFSVSCTSYKHVPYFQDLQQDSVLTEKIDNFRPLTIQPGDLLAIHVTSLNHEADAAINYNLERPNGNTAVNVDRPEENAVVGYLVNTNGEIHLPYVGAVKVAGISILSATSLLETQLSNYLSKPVITLRIQNFKVAVLGDVKNPGTYYAANERITLTEALSMAGDLNTTGLRENVLLIRESNGERKYVRLDLTSKNIFSSPYYYLRNNDVIYVQPNKEQVHASDSSFQKASIIISALSLLAIFLTRFK